MIDLNADSNGHTANTWHIIRLNGANVPAMVDSNGHRISLAENRIKSDGTSMYSVRCKEKGCKFHSFVHLNEWGVIPLPFYDNYR